MFYNANKLTTIYVGEGWNTNAVTNSTDMFILCTALFNANAQLNGGAAVDVFDKRIAEVTKTLPLT